MAEGKITLILILVSARWMVGQCVSTLVSTTLFEPTTSLTTTIPLQSEAVTSETTTDDARPIGLESGAIPDSSFSASSQYNAGHGPWRGRLNIAGEPGLSGGWVVLTTDENQFIQVDLLTTYRIAGVATQGRQDYPQWVTSFKIACSMDSTNFDTVKDSFTPTADKIFPANSDQNTVVYNHLPVAMLCRYVRLLPVTWRNSIAMRMELYAKERIEVSTLVSTSLVVPTTSLTSRIPVQMEAANSQTTAGYFPSHTHMTRNDAQIEGTVSLNRSASTNKTTSPRLKGLSRVIAEMDDLQTVSFCFSLSIFLYFSSLVLALVLRCIMVWIKGMFKKEVEPDTERPKLMYELVNI